jgi:integrase
MAAFPAGSRPFQIIDSTLKIPLQILASPARFPYIGCSMVAQSKLGACQMHLTKSILDRLSYGRTGNAADYYWHDALPGFAIRVYPSGRKSFVIAYRTSAGTKRFFTLGDYGSLTLASARDLARKQLQRAREGFDHQAEKRAMRAQMTFSELAERYLDHAAARGKKSIKDDRQRLRDHILPKLGHIKLSEITLRSLQLLHERIAKSTSNGTANRCAALIKKIFSVAVDWEIIKASPAKSLKMLREAPPRDVVLTPDQCRALLQACDDDTNPYAAALFELAMLTGRRVGELLALKWEHVDLEKRRLRLPDTKVGEQQYVFLNVAAADVLRRLPRIEGNPFVIAGERTGRPLNFYRRAWLRILHRAGLEFFPPHGLRHNYASLLVAAGVPLETVGQLLGHKSSLTTRKYAHHRPEHLHRASGIFSEVIDLGTERQRRRSSGG